MAVTGVQHDLSGVPTFICATIQSLALELWNTSGTPALESYTAGNIADYRNALTELGSSGFYYFTIPATLPVGYYTFRYHEMATANTLTEADLANRTVATESGYWNGTTLHPISADVNVTSIANDAITGDAVAASAVTKIQNNLATSTEVTAIQNNTRVVRVVPAVIERPDSGTTTYRIELLLYDQTGNMEAPDSAPTIELVDQGGTDLSSRLDSATMTLVETGRYRAIYTATNTDDVEQLVWTFSVVEGGSTRKYGNTSLIVDTTAVDFTSTDRANLALILGDTDELQQNQGNWLTYDGSDTPGTTTLLSRLTATRAGYLDTINDLADGERLDLLIDFLVDMAEADEYVVTSTTPWQIAYMKKGTGAPGMGTELYRKNVKNTAGADLTAESTVVGQLVEPA